MGQGEEVEQFTCVFGGFLFRDREIAGIDMQVLFDRQVRVEGVLLMADADAGFDGAPMGFYVEAEYFQTAAGGR
jgi:hypothetical protein